MILLESSYSQAVDVWSLGCIMGELFNMHIENGDLINRTPLFPGTSCFPLSPDITT